MATTNPNPVPTPNTPVPPVAPSVMAPVGLPAAAHTGPPVGIPTGVSAADLQIQLQLLQEQMARLMAVQGPAPEAARELKTYYHQTPGSTIVVTTRGPRGEQLPETFTFIEGRITTANPAVQDFLDGIVDGPGVPIYSSSPRGKADEAAAAAAAEVIKSAARTIDKLGAEAGVVR